MIDINAGEVGVQIVFYVNPQPPPPNYSPLDARTATGGSLRIQDVNGTVYTGAGSINFGSVDGTAQGSYAQYTTTSADFVAPGTAKCQLVLDFSGGVVRKSQEMDVTVHASL